MKLTLKKFSSFFLVIGIACFAIAANVVPNEVQLPGTQPLEVAALESPNRCDNCHGGYNAAVEPAYNWRGSMMANASRDPIFWATMAIAEQDFDGAGDLCIRCHSTSGWMAGRSTPTDGSGLNSNDADGVECDSCHKMTKPDWSEHLGKMTAPFIANNQQTPSVGFFGSGMMSIWPGAEKLGPYTTSPPHSAIKSNFHRDKEFCGTCHDVSNSVVGDLAHNNGRQPLSDPIQFSGILGAALTTKAAFRNFPYMYGIVERTHSEYMSSAFPDYPVTQYSQLPSELKAGSIQRAYQMAQAAGQGGNYQDGTQRTFTCQTCHMPPVTGPGCNKNGFPIRPDLPLHDMTGGNTWAPDAILHQNQNNQLRLGGSMTTVQKNATSAGKLRARQQLQLAAALSVQGNTVKVLNLTGHKLISGYPEGRRMWLHIEWYNALNQLIREDGAYGTLNVTVNGLPLQVESLVNLYDPNTVVFEAHYGMTKEWASQLLALGYSPTKPLTYDRLNGSVTLTLGQLSAMPPGTERQTFHFVLNNTVISDNRIPPYGFRYDDARKRNALPVPVTQYGNPGPGGVYKHWAEVQLNPPAGAARAEIALKYQSTSWEYIQFLRLANTGQVAFLALEGTKLLETWLATEMAEPETMAETTWTAGVQPPTAPTAPSGLYVDQTLSSLKSGIVLRWTANQPAPTGGYRIYRSNGVSYSLRGTAAPTAGSFADRKVSSGVKYLYRITAWNDVNANGVFDQGVDQESAPSASVAYVLPYF